jgi:hypothetical protein
MYVLCPGSLAARCATKPLRVRIRCAWLRNAPVIAYFFWQREGLELCGTHGEFDRLRLLRI